MPLARPTLAELIDRVRGDLTGQLAIDGPLLRRAMVKVLSGAWGGSIHALYGFLDWISKQLFGFSAEREALLPKAAMYDIVPTPATFAAGNVTATGVDGSVIPIDTVLKIGTVRYRVTVGQVIAAGVATLPVIAILAGAAGNAPEAMAIAFESPIAGVNASGAVDVGGLAGGVDEEGTEELRTRYLLRLREPPEGGADQDYEAWALAVAGCTRAWVYPNENGLGTVVVRFVQDGDLVSIFPDVGEVAAMQTALDAQRPITAAVTAVAPTNLVVPFTIHLVPNTADTRAAAQAELVDLFKRVAAPGDGAGRGTVLLSKIHTALGIAEGVNDYVLTSPAADVVPALGQLPTVPLVAAITWV